MNAYPITVEIILTFICSPG